MNAELTTSEFTQEQARRFTDEIKRDGAALWQKVAEAYDGRIWIALGYEVGQPGWKKYIADEFPDGLLIPPKERINDAIQHYLQQGLSTRAIAQVTDLNQATVSRRAKEIRETTADDANASPGNVKGFDGKQYSASKPAPTVEVEDAEIIDEGELHQPTAAPRTAPASVAPQAAPAEPSTQYRDVDELDAGDLGVEPMNINTNGHTPQIEAETVKRIIREYHLSGSSDTAQIKKTAGELRSYLESGMVDPAAWDEDELSVLAEDSADVVVAICDLLLVMAEGGQTQGTASTAVQDSELVETLPVIKTKVEALGQALNHTPARV